MAYKISKAEIRDAIDKCNGTQSSLTRLLKMKSQVTAMRHLNKYPDLVELFKVKREELLDYAEDVLIQNLQSKNDMIRARTSEFILKNVPGSRWVENDNQKEDVQVQLVKLVDRMIKNTD
jgi:hypothetical protein